MLIFIKLLAIFGTMVINFVPFDATKTPTETNKVRTGSHVPSSVDETQAIKRIENDLKQQPGSQQQRRPDDDQDENKSLQAGTSVDNKELAEDGALTGTDVADSDVVKHRLYTNRPSEDNQLLEDFVS